MKWGASNWSLLAGIGSLISAGVVLWAGYKAKIKADRQTEAQVITVTAEAAETVVRLTNSQYDRLAARVDVLELEILEERSLTKRLTARVLLLERFIRANNMIPPENGSGSGSD